MTKLLTSLAARIDALGLRERVLLFLAAMVIALALADTWLISPAQLEQKRLSASLKREDIELDSLRTQLRAGAQATGERKADSDDQADLARLKNQLDQVNRDIASVSTGGVGRTNALTEVLTQFLRQHDGLVLIRTATLAPEQGVAKAPVAAASRATATARRQGVELTVAGPYLELMNYVRSLETALPTLRWGSMKLTTTRSLSELNLQVYYVEVVP